MNQRSATVKVGLLTIISLVVLITTVIWLRGRTLGGGENYEVYFQDVDGLRQGAPVQFMGIRVGFVDEVTPLKTSTKDYEVKVKFTITEPGVKVPKGSYLSLEQSGIIGEKFMEITPPRTRMHEFVLSHQKPMLQAGLPIKVTFKQGTAQVGRVLGVKEETIPRITRPGEDYKYQVYYVIDKPGYLPPDEPVFRVVKVNGNGPYLALKDSQALFQNKPQENAYYTVEEPLRLKVFLEQQLASAEALKTTNQKINQLLSDEAIASIQGTLKNSEQLTAQATQVLKQANTLFASTASDLKVLVASTQELTSSVVAVSNNINEVAGNPELKASIQKTVHSVDQSTAALASLLNDPDLKAILSDSRVTSQNAAELMTYLKETAVDNDLQGRLNESLTLLNSSLTRLSSIMESLESVSGDKDAVKQIIEDTRETSENLNQFSERLNKRFLLFRLLF